MGSRVVVETPRGTEAKLTYKPKKKLFEYTRPLPAGLAYPYDWSFLPSTLGDDGDALDGLVIHEAASAPGVVIKCDLLAALRVMRTENAETVRNDRYVFCPHRQDAHSGSLLGENVPDRLRSEIEQFFLASVSGTDKQIEFEGWHDSSQALRNIHRAMRTFERKQRAAQYERNVGLRTQAAWGPVAGICAAPYRRQCSPGNSRDRQLRPFDRRGSGNANGHKQ
ncbi:MAG: inorganic diphosphatase [Mesorhizobium sp.]|nr:MAG: inorganic diphosphatase [Mesorhizobium sp.]